MDARTLELAIRAGAKLTARGLMLCSAESMTGGMLAAAITRAPGASNHFAAGIAAYSNESKKRLLGVPDETLDTHGAVSRETALLMARGAASSTGADVALAITGNAGPEASEGKPVGLVYICLLTPGGESCVELNLKGSRAEIREAATHEALRMLEGGI